MISLFYELQPNNLNIDQFKNNIIVLNKEDSRGTRFILISLLSTKLKL